MCYKIISFENKLNTNKIERATATQPQKKICTHWKQITST